MQCSVLQAGPVLFYTMLGFTCDDKNIDDDAKLWDIYDMTLDRKGIEDVLKRYSIRDHQLWGVHKGTTRSVGEIPEKIKNCNGYKRHSYHGCRDCLHKNKVPELGSIW